MAGFGLPEVRDIAPIMEDQMDKKVENHMDTGSMKYGGYTHTHTPARTHTHTHIHSRIEASQKEEYLPAYDT